MSSEVNIQGQSSMGFIQFQRKPKRKSLVNINLDSSAKLNAKKLLLECPHFADPQVLYLTVPKGLLNIWQSTQAWRRQTPSFILKIQCLSKEDNSAQNAYETIPIKRLDNIVKLSQVPFLNDTLTINLVQKCLEAASFLEKHLGIINLTPDKIFLVDCQDWCVWINKNPYSHHLDEKEQQCVSIVEILRNVISTKLIDPSNKVKDHLMAFLSNQTRNLSDFIVNVREICEALRNKENTSLNRTKNQEAGPSKLVGSTLSGHSILETGGYISKEPIIDLNSFALTLTPKNSRNNLSLQKAMGSYSSFNSTSLQPYQLFISTSFILQSPEEGQNSNSPVLGKKQRHNRLDERPSCSQLSFHLEEDAEQSNIIDSSAIIMLSESIFVDKKRQKAHAQEY